MICFTVYAEDLTQSTVTPLCTPPPDTVCHHCVPPLCVARTTLPFEHISDESLDGEGLGEMSKARRSFLGMECITLKELKASCWPPPGLVVRVKHMF